MSAKRACIGCRAKKIKCIPGPTTQRCKRCTTQGLNDCVYEPIKKRGIGTTLRMREACQRCRGRKIKCDTQRPCTGCVQANKATECAQEDDSSPPHPSDRLKPPLRGEPGPSDLGSRDIVKAVPGFPTKSLVTTITKPPPRPTPLAHVYDDSPGYNSLQSWAPPEPQIRALREPERHTHPRIILPPFSVLLSHLSPTIPPEPHVTLSSLGAERFQLSEAALGDLDMKFRLSLLCRLNKLGMRFTPKRQQALLHGDVSGVVIHPFFIYGAQTLGMYFCEGMDDSPAMVRFQARYLQKTLECFMDILKGHDWELKAQVGLWATAGSIIIPDRGRAPVYIRKSCEVVNTAGLRFIPTYGRPPEFSEDLHEKLSVLSQIIYFENFLFLTCGGAEPTMTARIEEEFRHQLQDVYPVLFKICPLAMRTQTILLVRDAVITLNLRPANEAHLHMWRQSCGQLVAVLDNHSHSLLSNLLRFQELGDNGGAGMIRSCCVISFAHLALLCEVFCGFGPAGQTAVEILCDSALERLSELSEDMRTEEYTRLDLLLGVSWRKALQVFDARLTYVPLAYAAKLRHCREVVAEVYSDFVAKLPGVELPALARRTKLEDGRTERSRYPNLIPTEEKQRLGL